MLVFLNPMLCPAVVHATSFVSMHSEDLEPYPWIPRHGVRSKMVVDLADPTCWSIQARLVRFLNVKTQKPDSKTESSGSEPITER